MFQNCLYFVFFTFLLDLLLAGSGFPASGNHSFSTSRVFCAFVVEGDGALDRPESAFGRLLAHQMDVRTELTSIQIYLF